MKKILSKFKLGILSLFALGITAYIMLASYEVVFYKDLRFVGAVTSFNSSPLISTLGRTQSSNFFHQQENITKIHKPKALLFTSFNLRLSLLPAIEENNKWIEVSNKGHYIFQNENPENGVGDGLVYLRKTWRTLQNPENLKLDGKFYLETEKYKNLYKIVEVGKVKIGDDFLSDKLDKPSLLLVIEDPENEVNYFVKAIFVAQEVTS